jgi:hypothetical protein
MTKWVLRACLILAASLFLTACQSLLNFSPDRAAVQEIVLNSPSMIEVHRDTIRVLQLQEFDPGTMVLATYLATAEGDQLSECLALFYAEKAIEGWNAHSRVSSCWPAELVEEEAPIHFIHGKSRSGDQSTSDTSGLVYDPEIKAIQLIWEEGDSQVLEVVKGSFLLVRTGQHELKAINALNESGELVYSQEIPAPAPGKDIP